MRPIFPNLSRAMRDMNIPSGVIGAAAFVLTTIIARRIFSHPNQPQANRNSLQDRTTALPVVEENRLDHLIGSNNLVDPSRERGEATIPNSHGNLVVEQGMDEGELSQEEILALIQNENRSVAVEQGIDEGELSQEEILATFQNQTQNLGNQQEVKRKSVFLNLFEKIQTVALEEVGDITSQIEEIYKDTVVSRCRNPQEAQKDGKGRVLLDLTHRLYQQKERLTNREAQNIQVFEQAMRKVSQEGLEHLWKANFSKEIFCKQKLLDICKDLRKFVIDCESMMSLKKDEDLEEYLNFLWESVRGKYTTLAQEYGSEIQGESAFLEFQRTLEGLIENWRNEGAKQHLQEQYQVFCEQTIPHFWANREAAYITEGLSLDEASFIFEDSNLKTIASPEQRIYPVRTKEEALALICCKSSEKERKEIVKYIVRVMRIDLSLSLEDKKALQEVQMQLSSPKVHITAELLRSLGSVISKMQSLQIKGGVIHDLPNQMGFAVIQ